MGLTFNISGLNLGGGLGGKYWISVNTAYRIEIKIAYENNKRNYLDMSNPNSYNSDITRYTVTPSFGVEKHFKTDDNITPYIGGSIGIMKEYTIEHNVYTNKTVNSNGVTSSYNGTIFIGVEYWLTRNISLSGEQELSINYNNEFYYSQFRVYNSTSSLMATLYF
jgi:outer membrane protein W